MMLCVAGREEAGQTTIIPILLKRTPILSIPSKGQINSEVYCYLGNDDIFAISNKCNHDCYV